MIREEICRPDGTIADVHLHEAQSEALPAIVLDQARAILEQPTHEQLSFLGVNDDG